ncbi:histone H2B type 1-A-like [Discoglossus pictus]
MVARTSRYPEGSRRKKMPLRRQLKSKDKLKKRPIYSFGYFVKKVLKEVFPSVTMSEDATTLVHHVIKEFLNRVLNACTQLVHYSGRKTLSSRELQAAVRLILPKGLAKSAVNEATKSVAQYIMNSSQSG